MIYQQGFSLSEGRNRSPTEIGSVRLLSEPTELLKTFKTNRSHLWKVCRPSGPLPWIKYRRVQNFSDPDPNRTLNPTPAVSLMIQSAFFRLFV